jgi:SAM-dependent methyltransferase
MTQTAQYVLGSEAAELERLELQAQSIAVPTMALLRASGLAEGMRVLDLGCGLGHVSQLLADIVGPGGGVVGVDRDARMVAHAEARRAAAGLGHVRFVEDDARTFRDAEPFDAVVERLCLFHLPEPVDVVRHHAEALRPGGIFTSIDFDCGALRAEPPTELMTTLVGWMMEAFRAAQADPVIGVRLQLILREAGLADVGGFGVQGYSGPDDRHGPAVFTGVLRSLAPKLHAAGIATEAELDLPTLHGRIVEDLRAANAVVVLPTVVGAFGRRAAA